MQQGAGRRADLDEGGEAPCASSHVYDLGRPRAPAPHVFCHRHKRHALHTPQQQCQAMSKEPPGAAERLLCRVELAGTSLLTLVRDLDLV